MARKGLTAFISFFIIGSTVVCPCSPGQDCGARQDYSSVNSPSSLRQTTIWRAKFSDLAASLHMCSGSFWCLNKAFVHFSIASFSVIQLLLDVRPFRLQSRGPETSRNQCTAPRTPHGDPQQGSGIRIKPHPPILINLPALENRQIDLNQLAAPFGATTAPWTFAGVLAKCRASSLAASAATPPLPVPGISIK